MKYFKSNYTVGIKYPKGWYGTLDFAPPVNVLMYNDLEGYCIGTIGNVCRKQSVVTEEEKTIETNLTNPTNINFEITTEKITRKEDNVVVLKDIIEYNEAVAVIKKHNSQIMLIETLQVNVILEKESTVIEMKEELQRINPNNKKYNYLCGIDGGGHKFIKIENVEFIEGIEYITPEESQQYLQMSGDGIWSGEKLKDRW